MNRIQILFGLLCLLVISAVPYAQAESAEEWTGCYAGINGGYGSAHVGGIEQSTNSFIGSATVNGGTIGGQAGCDQQSGEWVYGVQLSADGSSLSGSHVYIGGTSPSDRMTYKIDFLATVTGRVGYALMPEMLAYLKAGGAMLRTSYDDSDPTFPYTGRTKATRYGWMIGAGLERKIDSHLSGYIEYNYMNFGRKVLTINYTGGFPSYRYSFKQTLNYFGLGVNYRF